MTVPSQGDTQLAAGASLTQQGRPLCGGPEQGVLLGEGRLAPLAGEGDAVLGQGPGRAHGVSPQWLAGRRAQCGQKESPEGAAGGQGWGFHHLGDEGARHTLAWPGRHPALRGV